MEAAIVFVLGPPGAGKGTLCKRLGETFNMYHLSVGDHLREIRKDPTSANGRKLRDYLGQNELRKCLPGELLIPMLWDKIAEEGKKGAGGFLIDGFPRSHEQLQTFEKGKASRLWLAISFECDEKVCRERFLTRMYQDRKDDESAFTFRFDEYQRNTPEILDELAATHKCNIVKIDTSDSEANTWDRLLRALDSAGIKGVDDNNNNS